MAEPEEKAATATPDPAIVADHTSLCSLKAKAAAVAERDGKKAVDDFVDYLMTTGMSRTEARMRVLASVILDLVEKQQSV